MNRNPSTQSRARGPRRRRPSTLVRAVHGLAQVGLWMVAIVFLGLFVHKVWRPYGLNRTLHRDLEMAQRQYDAVQADNARQRRRIKYLQTPQGMSAEARRLGYHFTGEVPLRIQEPPPPPATARPNTATGSQTAP